MGEWLMGKRWEFGFVWGENGSLVGLLGVWV